MPDKKLNLKDQASELKLLADEIEIPVVTLPSRAAVQEPEPESARPEIVRDTSSRRRGREATNLESLIQAKEDLVPLSVRVPRRVRQELDRRVFEIKSRSRKIKMEDVVTAALVLFLKMDD